jgi:hypothetical protein
MVTGSRDWTDRALLKRWLLTIVPPGAHTLVHGGARGADLIAASLTIDLGWSEEPHPAAWTAPCERECPSGHRRLNGNMSGSSYCPDAGKRRNQEMVDSRPDLVIAFPTARSVGTWDAVRRARKAGIRVEVVNVREPVGS